MDEAEVAAGGGNSELTEPVIAESTLAEPEPEKLLEQEMIVSAEILSAMAEPEHQASLPKPPLQPQSSPPRRHHATLRLSTAAGSSATATATLEAAIPDIGGSTANQ